MEVVETVPPPPASSPSGKGSSRRKRVKFDLPTPAPVPGPSQVTPSSSLGGNLAGDVPMPAPTVNIPKATPDLTSFQKEWLERIESISDGASLEDALGKFTTILGGRYFRRRSRGHKRSTSAASRAVPPVDLPPPKLHLAWRGLLLAPPQLDPPVLVNLSTIQLRLPTSKIPLGPTRG
ncbi:hypothetical protein NPIL_462501 [Nephila pilipes]|uniref:Uncharacterized protein n=1 Tax=Nephila pilipes TaxID=299642 RepID=A0A8X6KFP8_NEPPI|nr:hypothetical protein NPIL_462501 [Nephila pilipes]